MDKQRFWEIWDKSVGQAARDRQTYCPEAERFREKVGKPLQPLLFADIDVAQLSKAKTLVIAKGKAWEKELSPAHFPSLGGSHRCISTVVQELVAQLDLLITLHAAYRQIAPPSSLTPELSPKEPERTREEVSGDLFDTKESFDKKLRDISEPPSERDDTATG
jgi:hypothetical protein